MLPSRRRYPRARDLGLRAIVSTAREPAALVIVQNLSAGGAWFTGSLDVHHGDRLELRLLEFEELPIVRGFVLRVEILDGAASVAVAFRELAPELEWRLQTFVLRTIERQWRECPGLVLLGGLDSEVRVSLDRDLASIMRLTREAATPHELAWHLEDPALHFDTVVLDYDRDREAAIEALAHLIVVRPDVRRVLLSADDPALLEREITGWRAHSYITKPWSRGALIRAIGVGTIPS